MNENQNVDIDREQNNGQITYANEVISTIVSVATTEVDGISAIAGNSGLLGKGKLPRGVRVDMNGEDVSVDVSVTVDYGMPIQKVGRSAQENVRKSIESMLARSSGLYLFDRKIRKNPNPFPIWKIWFGLYWFGAGNRTGFSRLAAARSAPLSGHTVA